MLANLRVCKAQSRVESLLANLPSGLEVCKQTCEEGRKFACKLRVQVTQHLGSSTAGSRNSFRTQNNQNSLRNEKDKTTKNSPQRQKRCLTDSLPFQVFQLIRQIGNESLHANFRRGVARLHVNLRGGSGSSRCESLHANL